MIELTRRWFICGTAAAIATAALPTVAGPAIAPITPVPSPVVWLRRAIYRLDASFEYDKATPRDEFGQVEIFRGAGNCLFSIGLNTRACFTWRAIHGGDWIILPNQTLDISLRSPRGFGTIDLYCEDKVDDGPPIHVLERHVFPVRGPTEIIPLFADNSLDARLEREYAKTLLTAQESEEEDADDEEYELEPWPK